MKNNRSLLNVFALILAYVVTAAAAVQPEDKPRFRLPETIVAGSPLAIRLTGLKPNATVQINAERIAGWREKRLYRSTVTVTANEAGVVDLSKLAPNADSNSSYSNVEPLGLLWSMKAVGDEVVAAPEKDTVTFTALVKESDRGVNSLDL